MFRSVRLAAAWVVGFGIVIAIFASAYRPSPARLPYENAALGFRISLPASWAGFRVTEVSAPGYRYAAFTYGDPGGAKAEFSIIRIDHPTAVLPPGTARLTADGAYASAVSPSETNITLRARLAEIPDILSTFTLVGSTL